MATVTQNAGRSRARLAALPVSGSQASRVEIVENPIAGQDPALAAEVEAQVRHALGEEDLARAHLPGMSPGGEGREILRAESWEGNLVTAVRGNATLESGRSHRVGTPTGTALPRAGTPPAGRNRLNAAKPSGRNSAITMSWVSRYGGSW